MTTVQPPIVLFSYCIEQVSPTSLFHPALGAFSSPCPSLYYLSQAEGNYFLTIFLLNEQTVLFKILPPII